MCSFSNLVHILFATLFLTLSAQDARANDDELRILDELLVPNSADLTDPSQEWPFLERTVACGSDKSQTICLPPVGSECGSDSINGVGFTDGEKADMLKFHNEKRAMVARGESKGLPKAGNMHQLVWNDDLAQVAQRWADQCIFEHDTASQRAIPGFASVGQNIYLQKISKKMPGIPIEKAVQKWYDEDQKFSPDQIEPFKFTPETGHFSQLAWADSKEVGCGWSNFMGSDSYWQRIVVCNYGPGGNYEGKSMYAKGEPCSACPSGCSADGVLCS